MEAKDVNLLRTESLQNNFDVKRTHWGISELQSQKSTMHFGRLCT